MVTNIIKFTGHMKRISVNQTLVPRRQALYHSDCQDEQIVHRCHWLFDWQVACFALGFYSPRKFREKKVQSELNRLKL